MLASDILLYKLGFQVLNLYKLNKDERRHGFGGNLHVKERRERN